MVWTLSCWTRATTSCFIKSVRLCIKGLIRFFVGRFLWVLNLTGRIFIEEATVLIAGNLANPLHTVDAILNRGICRWTGTENSRRRHPSRRVLWDIKKMAASRVRSFESLLTSKLRSAERRKHLYKNLITALVQHERIETTLTRCKDLSRVAERVNSKWFLHQYCTCYM